MIIEIRIFNSECIQNNTLSRILMKSQQSLYRSRENIYVGDHKKFSWSRLFIALKYTTSDSGTIHDLRDC